MILRAVTAFLLLLCTAEHSLSALPERCKEGFPTKPSFTQCTDPVPHFYYNAERRECRSFDYYEDCLFINPNSQNNFLTLKDCQENCSFRDTPPTQPPFTLSDPKCSLKANSGLIDFQNGEFVKRYYYNTTFHLCAMFHYTGQGGNSNNFETLEDCRKTCYIIPRSTNVSTLSPPTSTAAVTRSPIFLTSSRPVLKPTNTMTDVGATSSKIPQPTTTSVSTHISSALTHSTKLLVIPTIIITKDFDSKPRPTSVNIDEVYLYLGMVFVTLFLVVILVSMVIMIARCVHFRRVLSYERNQIKLRQEDKICSTTPSPASCSLSTEV